MSQDKDLIDYLLLLRYGSLEDLSNRKPALSLSAVAKVSLLNQETVRRLIAVGIKAFNEKADVVVKNRRKLKTNHLEYLSSPHTLDDWAHLSLK